MIEHTIDTLKDIEALCVLTITHLYSVGEIREDSVGEVLALINKRWENQPNYHSAQELANSFIEYLKAD